MAVTLVPEPAQTLERPALGGPPEHVDPPRRDPPRRRPTSSQVIVGAIGVLAAVLYTWGLSRNGMANSYYAAAVRSGARSWKAFFFGSLDPGSFITVDKPPAALWVMELSARLFGFSSWSMLLPEAAAGVGSVLVLHRLVRKWAGDLAAHLAAVGLAVTPVAALMFRFNNPDALLTLCCLGAAWAVWSAIEHGRTRALVLAGALIGVGFDTKMLQAMLVLPALAVAYLWAGPPRLRRRLAQLAAAAGAMVVAGGWWVAAVALWPASARPFIGSTTDNSIISLIFGYNGLSRIFGSGSGSGPGGGGGFGGTVGVWRMFNSIVGGQIAWLIPMAVAGLAAGLWLTRRGPRTDRARAGWILFGLWAAVCAAVFSLSQGIFHPYYVVQLAPAIAALAGAGAVALWQLGRQHRWLAWTLPATVIGTGGLAYALLDRTPAYVPWLRTVVVVGALAGAAGLLVSSYRPRRLVTATAAALATVALLAGPTAYTLTTIGHASTGSTPSAGPTTANGGGFGGGAQSSGSVGGTPPTGAASSSGARPSAPPRGSGAAAPTARTTTGTASTGGGSASGPGGGSTTADKALITYLEAHKGTARYLLATFGSQSADSIIISSGQPVMAIGGFTGSDPAPTLAQFEELVAAGQVRYVLVSGNGGGGGGGSSTSQAIQQWVTQHGTLVSASTYGGTGTGGSLYLVSAS